MPRCSAPRPVILTATSTPQVTCGRSFPQHLRMYSFLSHLPFCRNIKRPKHFCSGHVIAFVILIYSKDIILLSVYFVITHTPAFVGPWCSIIPSDRNLLSLYLTASSFIPNLSAISFPVIDGFSPIRSNIFVRNCTTITYGCKQNRT